MVLPSPTLIATVLVLRILVSLGKMQATIESVAPVTKIAL